MLYMEAGATVQDGLEVERLVAELWAMLGVDCGPTYQARILAAAVEAVKKRVVIEVADGARSVRYEAPTVEEANRLLSRDEHTVVFVKPATDATVKRGMPGFKIDTNDADLEQPVVFVGGK